MITLKPHRVDYHNNNTPILYDREIDEFAHAVLADYKPALLKKPCAIQFEHFIEAYLNVTLRYEDIYSEDSTKPIFGVTAFRDGTLKVFNRERECISRAIVWANTIVLDNYVKKPGRDGLALFTGLHEAGHYLIHQGVYASMTKGQTNRVSGMVYCRRDAVENFGSKSTGDRTAREWREHQADYFAAAAAMPNATFIPFVNEYLRQHGLYKRTIILGIDGDLDILAKDLLPEYISEVYGVSKRAASIKLKKGGFVADG